MSVILKALNKAERDRQLGAPPALGSIQATRAKGRRLWLPLLIFVFISLAVAGFLRFVKPTEEATQGLLATDQRQLTDRAKRDEIKQPEVKSRKQLQLSSPTPAPDLATATKPQTAVQAEPAAPKRRTGANSKNVRSAPTVERAQKDPSTTQMKPETPETPETPDSIPLLPEMPVEIRTRFADITVTVHVFADTISDRFVLINMIRYGEGDIVDGDINILEVARNGVVVQYANRRFLVPVRDGN